MKKTTSWKFFIGDKHFCRIFDFDGTKPACKNLFIGSLLLCGTDNTQLRATGTEEGYCVCVSILKDLPKHEIDTALNLIDEYYIESLEEN